MLSGEHRERRTGDRRRRVAVVAAISAAALATVGLSVMVVRSAGSQAPAPGDTAGESPAQRPGPTRSRPTLPGEPAARGWVLDNHAEPIAGVQVAVSPLTLSGLAEEPETAVTAEDGSFGFAGLEPGVYRLEVSGEAVFAAETRWTVPGRPVRVLATRRAAIEGAVTDPGGAVAGIQVTLTDGRFPPPYTAVTDERGRFAFRDLLPGHYEVWAHAPRRASAVVPVDRTGAGPHEPVELALEPAVLVTGRAVDKRTGRGVAASIQLLSPDGRDARRTAVADDDGAFQIEGVPHGRWTVEASAPGYVTAGNYQIDTEGSDEIEILLVQGGSIAGEVVGPSGEPVRDAAIVLRGVGSGAAPADSMLSRANRARYLLRPGAVAGDPGRSVRWYHPLAGRRELPSNSSRQFGAARPGPRPEECGRGHCGVDIGHVRGSIVHAAADGVVDRVVRQAQPRAGRFVRVQHANGIATYYLHLDDIRDDLEPGDAVRAGEPVATLGRTGVQVSGAHLHFAMSHTYRGRTWFIDPEPMLRHAIVLERAAALEGAIGSLAVARSAEAETLRAMRADRSVDLAKLGALLGVGGDVAPEPRLPAGQDFTTDAAGRFRIDGLAPGRYVAVAVHPDFASGASAPFRVALGEHRDDVDIALSPGVIVYGRVTDDRSRPLGGAVIVAESAEAGHQLLDAVTDDDGRFELSPLSGAIALRVSAAGHGRAERGLRLRNATSKSVRREQNFELASADARLRGRVVDPDGFAIPGARVVIVGDGAGRGRSVFTDGSGRFALDGLPAGRYRVRVEAAGYPAATASASTADESDLAVPRGGGIRAEIRDAHTGSLIPGARVTARGPGNATASATAADGTVELVPLVAGTWSVQAKAVGYVGAKVRVDVPAGDEADEVTAPDVRVEIARGATIEGVVRDAHGDRAAGVTVEVGDASTKSDQDGRFRLADVATGRVTVTARRDDERGELVLELRPGDEYVTLEISLE